jgi:nicotinamidase/pyrazinamidase
MAEALLVIDYQNDFIPPDGALAVADGDTIAGRINELAADPRFDLVVATRDWHPADHKSFAEQGGPWPVHCVQGSHGAALSPALEADRVDAIVDAGYEPELEGYSGFEQTNLRDLLREHGIDRVTVVGLATDYCVKHTALDALREGLQVEIDTSAVRGVEVEPGDSERALDKLRTAGARVT